MTDRMFIYCDDASHAPKREPVDVFVLAPSGVWLEQPIKKRQGRAGHVGTGMHMIGDSPAATGWANDPAVSNKAVRTRYELACTRTPACRRRPVPTRQEHLFSVLDRWRAAGVSELPLAAIAASLREQAETDKFDQPRGNG